MLRRKLLITGSILTALTFAACSGPLEPGAVLPPACRTPAPLYGEFIPPDEIYYVQLRDGTDPDAESARLARQYGFTRRFVYYHIGPSFSAILSPRVVAQLRCERTVTFLEHFGGFLTPN